jgi:D-alanyl-D-alanine dipeptidase
MASEEAPPVMPAELVTMRTAKFISDVLDTYRDHVSRWWTATEIEQIEKDHKKLVAEYNAIDSVDKTTIAQHDHTTSFNSAWDDLKGRFEALRAFSGNLATVFPNTTSVESDFSILKWEKDDNRKAMTTLSLEGIFQAKHRELVMSI